jgi:hypothetical protein
MNCTICDKDYSLEEEGGVVGNFGKLPIAFCPTCLSSCIDMVYQLTGWDDHELDS